MRFLLSFFCLISFALRAGELADRAFHELDEVNKGEAVYARSIISRELSAAKAAVKIPTAKDDEARAAELARFYAGKWKPKPFKRGNSTIEKNETYLASTQWKIVRSDETETIPLTLAVVEDNIYAWNGKTEGWRFKFAADGKSCTRRIGFVAKAFERPGQFETMELEKVTDDAAAASEVEAILRASLAARRDKAAAAFAVARKWSAVLELVWDLAENKRRCDEERVPHLFKEEEVKMKPIIEKQAREFVLLKTLAGMTDAEVIAAFDKLPK